MSDHCRSCGAAITWAKTPSGKSMPLDDTRPFSANIVLNGDVIAFVKAGEGDWICHFATCPNADEHRGNPRQGSLFDDP